jgi:hypothetical protein
MRVATTMKIRTQTHYGLLVLETETSGVRMPLTQPVDDLLSFWEKHTPERLTPWVIGYANAGFFPEDEAGREKVFASIARYRKRGIPDLFLRASRKAARGKFPKEIAPYLGRVTFHPGGMDEMPADFLVLAAWSLDRAMREMTFEVRPCLLCRVPFLSTGRSRFCRRLAPGSFKQTCQDVGKVNDYRARRRAEKEEDSGNDH